ncbi:MAG: ATP-binding cassette domain-containing protein [Lachnospiraceae bacterium]|nr:ATP-binding cassette domain-containing protein [Lachnospiraceae bacterium]MBQ8549059.1 ATP-binding cassette domain-containing protein [Lachnospiraceae bacterium]
MLEIKSFDRSFPVQNDSFLKQVALHPGEIVALLGKNGSGKTTLIKEILDMKERPLHTITLDGKPVSYKNLHRLALGSCEHTFFGEFTVGEQMEFYEMSFPNFRKDRFRLLTEYFEIPMKWKLKDLSVGEKNQVETVFALCQGADYIFLDEPFANNDLFHRKDFYKLLLGILEETECLIIATHLVEEVESVIGRVLLVDQFDIVADVSMDEMEEDNTDVVTWLKKKLNYNEGKAAEFIRRMEEGNV